MSVRPTLFGRRASNRLSGMAGSDTSPGGAMRISLSAARRLTLLLTLAAAAPPALQARVEPSHGFDMFSAQEEVQAGQQGAAQVGKQLPQLPDSDPVTLYVQRLGAQ